jgi:dethiobiotin synthetase
MSARLIAVSGTGTNVGKTFVATALVRAVAVDGPVCGVKPFESGHAALLGSDQVALADASTVNAAALGFTLRCFRDPVAPPEAARRAGERIDRDSFLATLQGVRARFSGTLVLELAGGLFSPFDDACSNADILRCLAPELHVLVAPNRLGVIHDVRATVLAARASGLRSDALVLSEVTRDADDSSRPSNLAALGTWLRSTPIDFPHRCDDAVTRLRAAPSLRAAFPHR